MHLTMAVAKINKFAVRESGDTFESIERPHGGLSFVLADGQSSGLAAKGISIRVVRKVVADIAEGVRDGAAARAANDMLFTMRHGKISATLVIMSIELDSKSLIITRCGNSPVFVRPPGGDIQIYESDSPALGFYRNTRPTVDHIYLEPGLVAIACTDGIVHAGQRSGANPDFVEVLEDIWQREPNAKALADGLLDYAMYMDDGRPSDDMSAVVVHVESGEPSGPRRMMVEVPLPDH